MADALKEALEAIKTNTAGLRTEIESLKGKNALEDPLVKAKLEAYDAEFVTLKAGYEAEKTAREALDLKLQRAALAGNGGQAKNVKSDEQIAKDKAFEKFIRYGMGGASKSIWNPDEIKALSSLQDDQGAYLIPADFESGITVVAQNVAEIRPVSNVGTTSRDRVQSGKITQRAVIGWGTEGVAVSEQDLKMGLEDLPINEITALVLVPNSTLEDQAADIFGEMTTIFGEDISVEEDKQFVKGNGVNRPEGILSHAGVIARYVPTGVATDLFDGTHNGVDALIQLIYKPKKLYRNAGKFAFNSLTEAKLRQFKDSTGQYLWQPPVQAGAPAALLGYSIINPEDMPDVGANSLPVVFGDFKRGYKIRDRKGMTVQRLTERYAEYRMTGFLVTKRVGGQVVMDEAFAVLKVATN